MELSITIEALRRELGLNQAEFAQRLGLANKASVSLLERGAPCSLPVALRLEELSGGRIDAAALNSDVAAARRASISTPGEIRAFPGSEAGQGGVTPAALSGGLR